ncbi:MAG: outer membrane beta-barrel protein [Steroidobacteraceae bacterium]|mgnify:CR=1
MPQHRCLRRAYLFCLLLGVTFATTAQAQYLDRGWTLELAAGKTSFKDVSTADLDGLTRDFFDSFTLPVQTLASTLDTRDRSLGLSAGYRFNRWLAADVGFYSLGSFRYAANGTVSDAGVITPAAFTFNYRVRGILLGGTATLPLGRNLELRARAGISNSDVTVRYSATVGPDTLDDKYSGSSQDFYYGVGAAFVVWDYYRIGVDYLHHAKVGKTSTTGTTDVDNVMLTLGFRY